MLRKVYLVPADHYHGGHSPEERSSRRKKQHPFDEWIKMSHKFRDTDISPKTRTKAISDFLRRVMLDRAPPNFKLELTSPFLEPELSEKQLKVEAKTQRTPSPIPSASPEIVYDDVRKGGQTEKDASPRGAANLFSTHNTVCVGMASN